MPPRGEQGESVVGPQPTITAVPVAPRGDEEVTRILARVLREAKKDWADLEAAWPEDDSEELQQQAVQERLGFVEAPAPHQHARRLAVRDGFSLHANTAVHGHDREGLERLCRYGARGPLAESRLEALDDGSYQYSPKKGTAFTLTAAAVVRRLVALLPPARLHLTSHHGAYAPNARLRPLVTQPPPHQQPPSPPPSAQSAEVPASKPKRPRLDCKYCGADIIFRYSRREPDGTIRRYNRPVSIHIGGSRCNR